MKTEEYTKERKEEQTGVRNAIYVGDLPNSVTESYLFKLFSTVGHVSSINIPQKGIAQERKSLFAYVTFYNEEAVNAAIEAFNFYKINGAQIRVMPQNREVVVGNKEGNVLIKNLPKETDNQALNDTFAIFGKIVSCKVQKNMRGECTGVGFLQFENAQVAEVAIEMINRITMKEKRLVAVHYVPNTERVNKKNEIDKIFTNVYVKNFPKETKEEELYAELEKIGELTSFYAPKDEKTGMLKGFAFANYAKHEDAVRAIELLHDKPYRGEENNNKEKEDSSKKDSNEEDSTNKRERSCEDGAESTEGESKAREEQSSAQKHRQNFYIQRAKAKDEREEEVVENYMNRQKELEEGKNIYILNLAEDAKEEDVAQYFAQYGQIKSYRVHRDTINNRGYGYVCYETKEQAAEAVEKANGAEYNGRELAVSLFKPRRVREFEKTVQSINGHKKYTKNTAGRDKKKPVQQENNTMGYEIYKYVLSLAPNYKEKIEQAGFATDDEFAKKITGMILELENEEVRNAYTLGNVLSSYVEDSLEEIIKHAQKDKDSKKEQE